MDQERGYGTGTERRSTLSRWLFPLFAFLAGLAAMGWLLSRWDSAAALIGVAPAPVEQVAPAPVYTVEPETKAPQLPAAAPETERLVIDPETARRVNRLEERVTLIDNQSRAAVGNADRAEGLLVAFAARRAIDRGVELGYIEGLLRQRFGERQRPAVAAILTASRQPVTLAQLQADLATVGPELAGGGPDQSWWTTLRAELGGLVTIRKDGTPSTLPAERLRRAVQALDTGQVDVALAEVMRMPGRGAAGSWISLARRYIGARRALDSIETAALLEPRMPAEAPRR